MSAPTEEDDRRLQYARYVLIAAVFVCAIGLVLCITLSIAGLTLVLLALLVMFAVAMLNCYVTMQRREERLSRSHRQPEFPTAANLYPQITTPTNTGAPSRPGTSRVQAALQADLPT
ncbi:Hypp5116 [Branchiostoma lanceolatum]|uniref:Hypp5116 protein n=1 Tax=Branchiostoma lanceolatum TaxID=7740 RepID=A0A8K0ADL5_BRALA|nr:Hypp5116 [Branchiostoma lanceolatum]